MSSEPHKSRRTPFTWLLVFIGVGAVVFVTAVLYLVIYQVPNYRMFSAERDLGWGKLQRAERKFERILKNGSNPRASLGLGTALGRQGKIKAAFPHLSDAMKDESLRAKSLFYRSALLAMDHRYDMAIKDLSAAGVITEHPRSLRSRGVYRYLTADFKGALTDLDRFQSMHGRDPYASLFVYLVNRRLGENASDLSSVTVKGSDWGNMLLSMYRQESTLKELQEVANNSQGEKRLRRVCEANFYGAQIALIESKPDLARTLLTQATEEEVKGLMEYSAGVWQLQRLIPLGK
jgi:tetratricopeptide (TPR) repeat protein